MMLKSAQSFPLPNDVDQLLEELGLLVQEQVLEAALERAGGEAAFPRRQRKILDVVDTVNLVTPHSNK